MARGPRMRMPRSSATPEPPADGVRELDVDHLESTLELACLDAIRGDAAGPSLAKTLERVCREVLRKQGFEGMVSARSDAAGTEVHIRLTPGPRLVEALTLTIGGTSGRLR